MPAFVPPRNGVSHIAYGETIAPPKVDTLRDENCPICGEDNAYDGHRCSICGYVAPPSPFKDPDLGMASRIDLRHQQEQFDDSMVTDPDRMAEQDLGGTLVCPNCGMEFPQEPPETVDTDEAAPDVSAEETEEGEGAAEGDLCPNCQQGILQAQDTVADEEAEEGEINPDDEDPDAKGEAAPFGGADPEEDKDQDGVPDEDEEEPPGVAVKSDDGQTPDEDEDPDDEDDDEDQPVRKPKPKDKK